MTTINSIAVLGDSTSTGFATQGRSYAVLVGEALTATTVENFAVFGRTAKLMVDEDLSRVADLRPDMVIVHVGMGDSLPHPGERVQRILERFAPPTWHGVYGLERRAYFSGTRWHRVTQWVVAETKTTIKRALIGITGGYTRATPVEFERYFDQLLTELADRVDVVVSIGLFDVDQHRFPKQHVLNLPFREKRFAVLSRHPQIIPVEINQRLDHWGHFLPDRAHWNAAGHAAVADEILQALRTALPELNLSGITDESELRPPTDDPASTTH